LATKEPLSCFVISPIGDERTDERRHADMVLHRIIEPSFNAVFPECKVIRSDKHSQPGSIPDSIVRYISNSDICVADLSFLNSNVFYELGICHALRKTVIHIAKNGTKLPFDNYQQYTIFFDPFDHHELLRAVTRLSEAIRETATDGFVLTNPVINALAYAKIEETNSPSEIITKDIVDRLDMLSSKVNNIERHEKEYRYTKQNTRGIALSHFLIKYITINRPDLFEFDIEEFDKNMNAIRATFDDDDIESAISEIGLRSERAILLTKILKQSKAYFPF
jgi:hypothetical protein